MRLAPDPEETLAENHRAIVARRRTCRDVLERCLARIDAREAEVGAWVVIDRDAARAVAAERDRELDAGTIRGPLHGIPLGIKDIIEVAGLPTAAGFDPWAGRIATADAPIVARLRAAGAVVVGKTVSTQFAWIDPPPTRNPWALDRTPGGSSSGSAAAVACGMVLGALGTQTGGSITRPASYCGVAALKPSDRPEDLAGILPLAPTLDHVGPIARTVQDVALLWAAIEGPPGGCRDAAAEPEPAPPPRLGRLRGLFEDRADPVVAAAFEQALERLAAAGAVVTEAPLPRPFDDVLRHHRTILAAEAATWHQPLLAAHPDDYLPAIRALVEEGRAIPATEYIQALQHRSTLIATFGHSFHDVDALVVPATTTPAPDRSSTGDPAFNSPWSYLGLPVVSFPIALSPDGLPLALQVVGRSHQEWDLLGIGRWCESVAPL